jgi:anti-sigma B factor antagonist
MKIDEKTSNNVTILYPQGKIDNTNAPLLEKKMNDIIDKGIDILVNFEYVDYINSIGIRALILAIRKLKGMDKKLALCNINDKVMELLKVFDLTDLVAFYSTEDEALSSL